ncbi:MAG: sec-independent protein translocase protein TatB [Actinomycetota bacterium]|nr:sec-independent protein translocase protein TatB [Actinomycetota bacterium]
MSVGPAEILIILVVALLVFGPQRLPEVGRQVGSALRELRRMQDTVRGELDMVLHPEHGTSPSTAPPLEPDDHSAVDADVVGGGDDAADATAGDEDPGAGDPGFSGPSDSFT